MRTSNQFMPMLPGFYLPKRGRKPHSRQQKFSQKITSLRKKSFKQIGEIFGQFIPAGFLKQELSGSMSRKRLFTKENTFWSFSGQVLDSDGGCREVVKKLQSYASTHDLPIPSSSTASYCTVADISGHDVGTMLKHYAHSMDAARKDAINQLPSLHPWVQEKEGSGGGGNAKK